MDADEYIRSLAASSLAKDDAVGWWDTLYVAAGEGLTEVPWDRGGPHRLLAAWAAERSASGEAAGVETVGGESVGGESVGGESVGGESAGEGTAGEGVAAEGAAGEVQAAGARRTAGTRGRAVVVGCGLGGDAEFLSALGWETVAFDVSPAAVRTARERFPDSTVEYLVADLFALPDRLVGGFDLVLESMTVQALPRRLRERAIAAVRTLVKPPGAARPGEAPEPGGTLLVIAAAIEEGQETEEGPPWPLTRAEVASFAGGGLVARWIEEFRDDGAHRWRAEFTRQAESG